MWRTRRATPSRSIRARRRRVVVLALVALFGATLPAAADLAFVSETRAGGPGEGAVRIARVWANAESLRMEIEHPAAPEPALVVIFRGDRSLYWTIDPAAGEYAEIDRAEVERLGQRVRQARREMIARLPELPAEQREAVQAMLEGMRELEAPSAATETVVATDGRERIDGHDARRFALRLGDETVGELWAADWSSIGVAREDVAVFEKLAAFQRQLVASLGRAAGASFGAEPFEVLDRLDGFPLRMRRLVSSSVESETRFRDVRRVPPAPGRFDLPDGLARRLGPGGGGPQPPPDS